MVISNKILLEAIQRGINLAIDDFDGFDDAQDIETQKTGQIENKFSTAEQLDLRKYFVDLGLPSGTLWAKYNVGVDPAKLNKLEDWCGGYYAWGEVETKSTYNWTTYKYCNGTETTLTKYCPTSKTDYWCGLGSPDNKLSLEAMDDVVIQTNKTSWNLTMPTSTQISELCNATYVTNEWVTNYKGISGLNGRVFTSMQNGNALFIPAAGLHTNSSVYNVGSNCYLWSRSLYSTTPSSAYYLHFYSSDCYLGAYYRYYGFSARPVLVQ